MSAMPLGSYSAYFILESQNNVEENYVENSNDEYIEETVVGEEVEVGAGR